MRLIWARRAILDLAEIRTYIARDNPRAAARVAARIRQAVTRLTEHPNLGRPGRALGARELVISRTRYIVAYSVEHESVTILAVVHGARRWPRL